MNSNIKIIAEIASAHGGNISELKRLINESSMAKPDFIKLQIYKFNELVHKDDAENHDLKVIEIPPDDWKSILLYCSKKNINLITEVYDLSSFELLKENDAVSAFKIPTADINNFDLLKAVSKEKKLTFIGIGGSSIDEIHNSIDAIKSNGCDDIVLMHGIQSFPTRVEDCELNKIQTLKKEFGLPIGYADHIDADDKLMSFSIPSVAANLGSEYIEKHITLDRSRKGFDYYSSLNPNEFKDFISFIHKAYMSLGNSRNLELTSAEKQYREKMKKYAILDSNVRKGDLLASANMKYMRTSEPGLTRLEINKLRNKKFLKDIPSGVRLSKNHFKND